MVYQLICRSVALSIGWLVGLLVAGLQVCWSVCSLVGVTVGWSFSWLVCPPVGRLAWPSVGLAVSLCANHFVGFSVGLLPVALRAQAVAPKHP